MDGHQITVITTNKNRIFVIKDNYDTIYRDSVFSLNQQFVYFDSDTYKDILLDYSTNMPGIKDVLLYDKVEKTYKKVVDLHDYPAPQRIGNTKYYYSYHHSGCADMNWDSDLFYIENYQTVKIGNISGRQCDDTGVKDGIYINKIVGKKEFRMAELPITVVGKYKDHKWGFIAHYWKQNFRKFL